MSDAPQEHPRQRAEDPASGVHAADDRPGSGNSPAGEPGERPAPGIADRVQPGGTPPAANQGKDEPVPATPDRPGREASATSGGPQQHSAGTEGSADSDASPEAGRDGRSVEEAASTGQSSRAPGEQGELPDGTDTDDEAGAARTSPGKPPGSVSTDPGQGETHGVDAGASEPAPGTSEESEAVTGINTPVPQAGETAATTNNPQGQAIVTRPSAPDGEVGPA